jgi:hypothetical protein
MRPLAHQFQQWLCNMFTVVSNMFSCKQHLPKFIFTRSQTLSATKWALCMSHNNWHLQSSRGVSMSCLHKNDVLPYECP